MNKNNIIFALGGAAAGATAMYFYMKDWCEKTINRELEDIKSYYHDMYSEKAEEKEVEEISSEDVEDVPERTNKPSDKVVEPDYNEIIEKLNYNEYSTSTSKLNEKPYIISMDEYGAVNDQVMLSYFAEDEVLINSETDEVIQDVGKTVGYDNLDHLSDEESGELYIRNDYLGIDYYVCLENMSYQDYIGEE